MVEAWMYSELLSASRYGVNWTQVIRLLLGTFSFSHTTAEVTSGANLWLASTIR